MSEEEEEEEGAKCLAHDGRKSKRRRRRYVALRPTPAADGISFFSFTTEASHMSFSLDLLQL